MTKKKQDAKRSPGRPAQNGVDTRALILEITSDLLQQVGQEGLSNRLICEKANVTPPTLYHHFPDKDALLAAVVEHAYEQSLAQHQDRLTAGGVLEAYRKIWDHFLIFADEKPQHFKLMGSSMMAGQMPLAAYAFHAGLVEALEDVEVQFGLKVSVELAAQLGLTAAFGIGALRLAMNDVPWHSDIADAAFRAHLDLILKSEEEQELPLLENPLFAKTLA